MINQIRDQYLPDYAVPPGETLLETIQAMGMSQADLAERTGRPKKTISEIVNGKTAITAETALQLERVLGVPASFWNNLERNYQETLARLSEKKHLGQHLSLLDRFPIRGMIKMGWLESCSDKVQQVEAVLSYFGVASPGQLERRLDPDVLYRKSHAFESDPGALAAWLRKGELDAQQIRCDPYDANKFQMALKDVRAFTVEPPETFQDKLEHACANCGVAVVFVPELPGTRASGATRWLNPSKALIQLSLRYKTNDHLWFTFFHEAGHILLHGKRDLFLEGQDSSDDKELEANRFAANFLIRPAEFERFTSIGQFDQATIQQFASEIGVAPGIVVGRLQHDDVLPYNHCNDLKLRLRWAN